MIQRVFYTHLHQMQPLEGLVILRVVEHEQPKPSSLFPGIW